MSKYRFSLDLQQFNDGEEVTEIVDPSSVETGSEDELDAGSASASDQQDVTKQQSFAARLSEERLKIEEQYAPHKQVYTQAEQIAKAAGFDSVDAYFAAVQEQLRQQQAEQEAEKLGVDPETYNQFFAPVHSELQQTKQELQRLRDAEFQRNLQTEYNRLSSQYPDFKEHEDKVFELAAELKLPPERLEYAYKLATFDSRIAATALETEQKVLANVTGRDSKQVLSAGDKGQSTKLDPSTMSLAEIRAISERVQRGERITFD